MTNTEDSNRPRLPKVATKLLKIVGVYSLVFFVFFVVVEIGLRIFDPQEFIVPASDFTPEYGVIAYPEQKIINAKPGHFRCVYTTNSLRYRGDFVPFDSPTRKVVLLGDSNVFGFGVQDDETISHNLDKLLGPGFDVINLANGGWSLPQQVRRYLELGQKYKPETVILHMASNDLEDYVYGINWVAMPDGEGGIGLREVPINPAGRLRKLLPPDSILYKMAFRSQVMMRVKRVLNRHAMSHLANVETNPDGSSKLVDGEGDQPEVQIPYEQVTVFDKDENQRRYNQLLEAFAKQLESEDVRFIFLTQESAWHEEFLEGKTIGLATQGLLEHYVVERWFVVGKDYPRSAQGHQWNADATKELAERLYDIIGEPEQATPGGE